MHREFCSPLASLLSIKTNDVRPIPEAIHTLQAIGGDVIYQLTIMKARNFVKLGCRSFLYLIYETRSIKQKINLKIIVRIILPNVEIIVI